MVQLNRARRNRVNCKSWAAAGGDEPEERRPHLGETPSPSSYAPRCSEAPLTVRAVGVPEGRTGWISVFSFFLPSLFNFFIY